MHWNRPMLLSLVLLLFAVTVNSKYRGPPDAVKMITVRGFTSHTTIYWYAFEVDTKLYEIELVGVHNGKSITKTVEDTFTVSVNGLEPNETYIVRVFVVNEHGQSPPSPEIILPLIDSGCSDWKTDCDSRPLALPEPIVEYMLGNRVKVTWNVAHDMVWGVSGKKIPSPTEFIIRYGYNKNTSLWNTKKTNNTWVILDDLKEETQYSAYVIGIKDNLTSLYNYLFPISLDEDMTGLPEPVITIESVFKKEVFTPGDPMTITCSVPPNTYVHNLDMELTVGERVEYSRYDNLSGLFDPPLPRLVTSVTLFTTANEDVDTAKCKVTVRFKRQVSRSSYLSWKEDKTLNDEYLRRRYEEIEADRDFVNFKKI